MALIKCPECGKRISDQAEACIFCGYPIKAKISGEIQLQENKKEPLAIESKAELAVIGGDSPDGGITVEKSAPKKRTKRSLLFTAGGFALFIILAGLSFYFFYYKPHFIPQQVNNANYTVQFSGTSYPCSFTGTMLNRKPQGSGKYTVADNGSTIVFEGEVGDDGTFTSGTVTGLPVVINTFSGAFTAIYNGAIVDGVLTDKIQVFEMPFSLTFDGTEYSGNYTGDLQQSLPNGEGTFKFDENDRYFTYTGSWENGQLKGNGEINSNDVVAHLAEVDRKGTYNGSVVNGVFCGKASFSATNDDGINYTYEGNWKNGLWDGQGKLIYNNADDYVNSIGTFVAGYFKPTVLEFLTSFGTSKNSPYTINNNGRAFIKVHELLFTKNTAAGVAEFIDTDFSYATYSKHASIYGDSLFRISGLYVTQAFECDDYWGRRITVFLVQDNNYNLYYGVLLNTSALIVEGRKITLTALPLDYSTYVGVDGNQHWAIRFAAVNIEP